MRRMLALAAITIAGCGTQPRPVAETGPSGTLYLAGRDPGTLIRVDAAAGTATTHRVPQLGGGDPPYMVAFTGGRVVVFALGRSTSLAPDLSDPRSLGEAWFFVPSATPGRVWNILLKRGESAQVVNFRGVREVTVQGEPTFARHAPVPGWPLAAVDGGIVVERNRLRVWDPVSARVVRTLPGIWLIAARGSLVASCGQPCQAVHLTDTRTGHSTIVRFKRAIRGAFSPDGRLLAVSDERGQVAVIDVARRSVRIVQRARRLNYKLVAWASSGWLYYHAGRGRLGAWLPGERARLLPAHVETFVAMAAD